MKEKKKAGMQPPQDAGKILKRLAGVLMKHYGVHLVIVAICIIINVLANVQGTMFMQTLIDDFISPLLQAEVPDFQPLLHQLYLSLLLPAQCQESVLHCSAQY